MDAPLDRNRLDEEPSPYLQQHADNPVHWQPWDEEALGAARERDRPIFCSIGYAACHWCHVMEEESFENEEIAEQLNTHYVPIKVDREERPDVDRIYQTICQLVNNGGGWPLSAFLTPDGRPFYVGTYFPPSASRGRPGFDQVLDRLATAWEEDREAIEERADQWQQAIERAGSVSRSDATPQESSESPLLDVASSALQSVDPEHGGFGEHGPKFPQPGRIDALLRAHARTGDARFRDAAVGTLEVMADRGLYDHLGGGFHRYATDREWRIPHFEKMLYDNAEIPRQYLRAHQLTDRDRFAQVVTETLAFVTNELQHPDGGFYSTLDAQSEGTEGAYYVWTPDQVENVVEDEERAAIICDRFGITASGNFEEGTSVLSRARSLESLAEEYERSEEELQTLIEEGRAALLDAREDRPRPGRDEKVLAGWNGLMISTLAEAGLVLDPRWIASAKEAVAFLREHLWDEETQRLSRRFKDGEVGIDGYLEDYAYLARGALDLYQVTGALEPLAFAVDLADVIVEEFYDETDATLYYTPESGEALVSRPEDPTDQSTPSSLAVGLEVLAALDHFVPDRGFEDIVASVIDGHRAAITGSPLQHVGLATVADQLVHGRREWTIVADELPEAWSQTIADTYDPLRLIARRPPTEAALEEWLAQLDLEEAPPIWANREAKDDRPTAYLCRDFTCSPPLTDPEDAEEWIAELAV